LLYEELIAGDPGNPVYPRGDARNDALNLTGMAGRSRQVACGAPVPGERFSLSACVDEETCLDVWGEGGCHPIGGEVFQTVGFMGGRVTDIIDAELFLYEVNVDGETTGAVSCDGTPYNIGDWVALAKTGTEFPLTVDYEQRDTVTDSNVPEVGIEDYVIIPYRFVGA